MAKPHGQLKEGNGGPFGKQTLVKPVVPRYNWDPWGRSNHMQVVHFGKTRVDIKGGSTRNKVNKLERSWGTKES